MPPRRLQAAGSVRADEVLSLGEFRRRFGWGEHAVRQARDAGLRMIPFGREKYLLGADVLEFFGRLASRDRPAANGHDQATAEEEPS